jgi:hypothetical protein
MTMARDHCADQLDRATKWSLLNYISGRQLYGPDYYGGDLAGLSRDDLIDLILKAEYPESR